MSESLLQIMSMILLLSPLAAAVGIGVLGPTMLRDRSHWLSILGVGMALVCAIVLFFNSHAEGAHAPHVAVQLYPWMTAGLNIWLNVEVWFDPLTAVMLLTVTGVALLVVIYSRDYMRDHGHAERGYERFFAFLALFVFSMCSLVLAGNFLLLYLGWELVGLCSYLLIGFYYQKPSAAAAAKKAFLVNRVGDFGFGLGILLIYLTIGHLDYETVFSAVAHRAEPEKLAALLQIDLESAVQMGGLIQDRLSTIALLLFCGAVGKSAQLPLHVWLPDAMEGPSPVSALIHAATMVTAGVYMVARCGAIFAGSPQVMSFVAAVGVVTALFAATIALVQHDMKRILAYSTISQLGYMFLGLGVFAADSAVFHLFTHAFFKALLFLGAGSVMHAMGGVIDLRYFGGLRKIMPATFLTMGVGSLALAGFPFLSGFWSKDEIIHAAFAQSAFLGWLAMITAALTAFYTGRMFFRAFYGETKVPEGVHAHESGPWMVMPLVILAIGAVGVGYFGVHVEAGGFAGLFGGHGAFHHFLHPVFAETFLPHVHHVPEDAGHLEKFGLMYASGAIAIVGLLLARSLYVSRPWVPAILRDMFSGPYELLTHKYYVDEIYAALIVKPLRKLGQICFGVDRFGVDGLVWLVGNLPRGVGFAFRGLQGGTLQGYGVGMVAGAAIVLIWVLMQ